MANNFIEHCGAANSTKWSAALDCSPAPTLRLNVVVTNEIATIASLRAAAALSRNLGAQITLISAKAVSRRFPLEQPPIDIELLESRLFRLVYEAGITGQEVRIQLCLCRNRYQGLRSVLLPHSIIVLARSEPPWSRWEDRLKQFLTELGHQVISFGIRSQIANQVPASTPFCPGLGHGCNKVIRKGSRE